MMSDSEPQSVDIDNTFYIAEALEIYEVLEALSISTNNISSPIAVLALEPTTRGSQVRLLIPLKLKENRLCWLLVSSSRFHEQIFL